MEKTQILNKLVVPTFRWLKVNSYNLKDFELPAITPYTRKYFDEDELVQFYNTEKSIKEISILPDTPKFGVGQEFISLLLKNLNAGVFIKIPEERKIIEPILIDYKMDLDNKILTDENIISVGKNSEVTIIFDYNTCNSIHSFHNGVTKVFAEEGAKVKIIKLQRLSDLGTSFDSNVALLQRTAKIQWFSVELGSKISLSNYITYLSEDESEASLDSIYLLDEERELDVSYTMIHNGRRTLSNIKTNGVLDDSSKKTFRGTLDFKRGAVKAKGSEQEFVLLLSDKTKTDSIPTLLCEEDDVEGQHAASIGQIDDNKLFYLMSRGLSEEESKKIIIEASFRPVLDSIPITKLKESIEDEIHRRVVNE